MFKYIQRGLAALEIIPSTELTNKSSLFTASIVSIFFKNHQNRQLKNSNRITSPDICSPNNVAKVPSFLRCIF